MKKKFIWIAIAIITLSLNTQISSAVDRQDIQWDVRTTCSDLSGPGTYQYGTGGFCDSAYISPPVTGPTVLISAGGTVPFGNYYCVMTYVDQNGTETRKSPESSIEVNASGFRTINFIAPITAGTFPEVQGSTQNKIQGCRYYIGNTMGGPYFSIQAGRAINSLINNASRSTPIPLFGYCPAGTDYSQQNAPFNYTNGFCYNTAGQSPYVITTDTSVFNQEFVGNVLIASNTTAMPNWTSSSIHAVITRVSGTTVTPNSMLFLDQPMTTGVVENGTFQIGGAKYHPGQQYFAAAVNSGNTVHIQSGTYTNSVPRGAGGSLADGGIDTAVAGTGGNPISWVGYKNTHRDKCNGSDRPLIYPTGTTQAITADLTFNFFENLWVKSNSASAIINNATAAICSRYTNIKASNGVADAITNGTGQTMYIDCEFNNNGDAGCDTFGTGPATFIGCYIHDNTNEGLLSAAINTAFELKDCVISSNHASSGMNASGILQVNNSIFYNNTGATTDGLLLSNGVSATQNYVYNCISLNNGRNNFRRNTATDRIPFFSNNLYGYAGSISSNLNLIMPHDDKCLTVLPSTTNILDTFSFFDGNGNPPDFSVISGSCSNGNGYPDKEWGNRVGLGGYGDMRWNIGIDQNDRESNSSASVN